MNILFVCTHNTGRSQMAAALYNKFSKNGHANSAGTKVDNDGETLKEQSIYLAAARTVIDVMATEGIDVSLNICRQINQAMLDDYDKVIIMAARETIPNYLMSSPKFVYWHIDDQQGRGFEAIEAMKDDVKRKIQDLL